jgi:hypothetical protein
VNLLVRSVLQDPEFLYRIEVGTPTGVAGIAALDSHEIAARLSYLVWGSAPDEALRSEADSGTLVNAADRRREAERLLGDDRARSQLDRFHSMWLGYRAIPHPQTLTTLFQSETNALIERVVFDDRRDYLDLFTFGETYVEATLAAQYGLPPPASGSAWVPYGDSGRAGILSHGSVLAAFSKFSDTSPTQRGIFVLNRLMCQKVPRPPANVDVDQPPGGDGSALCKYDRYAAHRQGSCADCHGRMDPIGFGLEAYDVAGRRREHDDGLPECAIEGKGSVPGLGDFSGPGELARLLVDAGALDECALRQYVTFATGHELDGTELVAVGGATERFRAAGRKLDQALLDFVESDAFALRKEPEETP